MQAGGALGRCEAGAARLSRGEQEAEQAEQRDRGKSDPWPAPREEGGAKILVRNAKQLSGRLSQPN